jgi:hypothetical protein
VACRSVCDLARLLTSPNTTPLKSPNRTACRSCPMHSYISDRISAMSVNACVCQPGYYTKHLDVAESHLECAECPKGATCEGDRWDTESMKRRTIQPVNLPGYWHGDNAPFDEFTKCVRSSVACRAADKQLVVVSENETREEPASNQCAPNHMVGWTVLQCSVGTMRMTRHFWSKMQTFSKSCDIKNQIETLPPPECLTVTWLGGCRVGNVTSAKKALMTQEEHVYNALTPIYRI